MKYLAGIIRVDSQEKLNQIIDLRVMRMIDKIDNNHTTIHDHKIIIGYTQYDGVIALYNYNFYVDTLSHVMLIKKL